MQTLTALFRSIALPFAHPRAAAFFAVLPCCITIGAMLLVKGASMDGESAIYGGFALPFIAVPSPIGPRTADSWNFSPQSLHNWLIWLASFAVFSLWICCWQIYAADPRTRLTDSLRKACAQWPAYSLAYGVWIGLPSFITFILTSTLAQALLRFDLADVYSDAYYKSDIGLALAPVFFLLRIPGMWLFARFSAVPPIIAIRGEFGSLASAWRLSKGRVPALLLALASCTMVAGLLEMGIRSEVHIIFRPVASYLMNLWDIPWLGIRVIFSIPWVIAWAIPMLWISAIPATIISTTIAPKDADPATFD